MEREAVKDALPFERLPLFGGEPDKLIAEGDRVQRGRQHVGMTGLGKSFAQAGGMLQVAKIPSRCVRCCLAVRVQNTDSQKIMVSSRAVCLKHRSTVW